MKKVLIGLFVLIAVAGLVGCAPDPRKEAEAYATRLAAEAQATAAAIQSDYDAQQNEIDLEARRARQAELALAWQRFVYVVGLVAVPVAIYLLFYFGRTGVAVMQGVGAAMVQAAEVKANLIHLDEKTRTFPLLRHVHGNRFLIHDANTGGTSVLDMSNAADRQLIATSGAVRLAGVVAKEARQSDDPTGVSLSTNVPVIGADAASAANVIDLVEVEHE